jgi:Zn-dependent M28 family amino/carboxypeptidase
MGPQLDRVTPDANAGRPVVEGWLNASSAKAVFLQAGMSLDESIAAASHRGFKARRMGLQVDSSIHNAIRYSTSSNVIAVLPGSERPKEYVFYTAHWDHLGMTTLPSGTQIFHGAVDNATGVAALLTLAQSLSRMPQRPARSIVFLSPTAEEAGLLGSAYYAEHPVYPLKNTAAVINIDAMHVGGPTRDVSVVGYGNSELENYLRTAASLQGREVRPEPQPEQGEFFRSDHFSFAKAGVPALYAKAGIDDAEHGPKWGQAQEDAYLEHRYHQPADTYSADWDVRGSLQDLELYLALGERLAHDRRFPNWLPSSEFRAIRERDRPEDAHGRPIEQ